MSLLVTGSIGIDTVEAPSGAVHETLGGSSIYFSYAASFFGPVQLVGVVGSDCPADFLKPLEDNPNIDLTGLEVRKGSKTFRWHGRYHEDVNQRDTVSVDLNVLAEAAPDIPDQFRDSQYVFLANTDPGLQLELLQQLDGPKLIVADTMDIWIRNHRGDLHKLTANLDGLVLNDSEARLMTGQPNIVLAGAQIAKSVRRFVVVKKGEHGCLLFADGKASAFPAWPSSDVVDPTGAGDSFAGAMMGYLAVADVSDTGSLHRAVAYGTVVASFTLEDFSLRKLYEISREDIDRRLAEFEELTSF